MGRNTTEEDPESGRGARPQASCHGDQSVDIRLGVLLEPSSSRSSPRNPSASNERRCLSSLSWRRRYDVKRRSKCKRGSAIDVQSRGYPEPFAHDRRAIMQSVSIRQWDFDSGTRWVMAYSHATFTGDREMKHTDNKTLNS
eukprot:scaffold62339_cov33-Tisochrysis_lutea.AAC.3